MYGLVLAVPEQTISVVRHHEWGLSYFGGPPRITFMPFGTTTPHYPHPHLYRNRHGHHQCDSPSTCQMCPSRRLLLPLFSAHRRSASTFAQSSHCGQIKHFLVSTSCAYTHILYILCIYYFDIRFTIVTLSNGGSDRVVSTRTWQVKGGGSSSSSRVPQETPSRAGLCIGLGVQLIRLGLGRRGLGLLVGGMGPLFLAVIAASEVLPLFFLPVEQRQIGTTAFADTPPKRKANFATQPWRRPQPVHKIHC